MKSRQHKWAEVVYDDVLKAILLFDGGNYKYTPARNTFLLFQGNRYPAKFIRGLAFKVKSGNDLSTDDYNGGEETARFFVNLGFYVEYKGQILKPTEQ